MSALTSRLFWIDVAERAVKTVCQTLVALLTSGVVGLMDVDWAAALSVSGMAGLVSVLTSVASAGTGNSASFTVDSRKKK